MSWTSRIPHRFTLIDGRKASTLADARSMMLALPERQQVNDHWQYAGELLVKAANHGAQYAVRSAPAQLSRALRAESLIA
jgi:hypothetical protein